MWAAGRRSREAAEKAPATAGLRVQAPGRRLRGLHPVEGAAEVEWAQARAATARERELPRAALQAEATAPARRAQEPEMARPLERAREKAKDRARATVRERAPSM